MSASHRNASNGDVNVFVSYYGCHGGPPRSRLFHLAVFLLIYLCRLSSAVLRQTRILTRLFQSKAGSFLRQFFGPEPLQANQDYACLGPGNEIELH